MVVFDFPWVPIFILFSPLWWVLLIVADALMFWAMNRDSLTGGVIVAALTVFALTAFGGPDWLYWIKDHPIQFWLMALPGWGIAGLVWATFYWWFPFNTKNAREYKEVRDDWLQDQKIEGKDIPKDRMEDFKDFLYRNFSSKGWVKKISKGYDHATDKEQFQYKFQVKQRSRDHKAAIGAWVLFWLWHGVWWLISDFVKDFGIYIQHLVGGMFDRISDYVYKDVEKDFEDEPVVHEQRHR